MCGKESSRGLGQAESPPASPSAACPERSVGRRAVPLPSKLPVLTVLPCMTYRPGRGPEAGSPGSPSLKPPQASCPGQPGTRQPPGSLEVASPMLPPLQPGHRVSPSSHFPVSLTLLPGYRPISAVGCTCVCVRVCAHVCTAFKDCILLLSQYLCVVDTIAFPLLPRHPLTQIGLSRNSRKCQRGNRFQQRHPGAGEAWRADRLPHALRGNPGSSPMCPGVSVSAFHPPGQ